MTPAEYPDDAFTLDQLAVLQAEPMLLVDILQGVPEGGSRSSQAQDTPQASGQVTIDDLDDLTSAQLVDVAHYAAGVTLDPKVDWFVLRADVEALLRAKADAEPAREV